jgi:hypothetical protein
MVFWLFYGEFWKTVFMHRVLRRIILNVFVYFVCRAMALCQLVFDVSFTRHITSDAGYVSSKTDLSTAFWNGMQFFGGLSVSIWTNILAIVVLKVVVTFEALNIRKNFYLLSAIALVPSMALGLLNIAMYDRDDQNGTSDVAGKIYTWTRMISILINFGAYAIIAVRAGKIAHSSGGEISQQQIMINELSRRMIYYPVMQSVCRVGAAIYERLYGYGPYPGNTSDKQFQIACVYAISAPAAGIGYLIIFLAMQPYAYEQFISLLTTGKPLQTPEPTSSALLSSPSATVGNAKYGNNSSSNSSRVGGTSGSSGGGGGGGGHHASRVMSRMTDGNDFHSTLARSSNSLFRSTTNSGATAESGGSGNQLDESAIQFLDDDELIRAIKESWKNATTRTDRDTAASVMSSLHSRDTMGDRTYSGSSSSSNFVKQGSAHVKNQIQLEMSSTSSFQTAATTSQQATSPQVSPPPPPPPPLPPQGRN